MKAQLLQEHRLEFSSRSNVTAIAPTVALSEILHCWSLRRVTKSTFQQAYSTATYEFHKPATLANYGFCCDLPMSAPQKGGDIVASIYRGESSTITGISVPS